MSKNLVRDLRKPDFQRYIKIKTGPLFLKRIISLFVAFCIGLSGNFVYAAPAELDASRPVSPSISLFKVAVPPEMGSIKEKFEGRAGKTIFIIQDAHAVPEAQRNIQKLIEYSQKEYGINLVGLESASLDLDPQLFKSFPDKKILRKIFSRYSERGELTGGNAAAVFSGSGKDEMFFHGIEDWTLYEEGLRAFLDASGQEESFNQTIKVLSDQLQAEKKEKYSESLFSLDAALGTFHRNTSDFLSVLQKLAAIVPPEKGSELELLFSEMSEDRKNQASLEMEIARHADQVRRILQNEKPSPTGSREQMNRFNEESQNFQTGRVTAEAYGLFLKEISAKNKIRLRVSQNLSRRVNQQKRMRDMEGTKLFNEFEIYERAVRETLFRNPEERAIDKRSRLLDLAERLAHLELTREEWNELSAVMRGWDAWTVTQDGVDSRGEIARLLRGMKSHFDFYRNAEKRDQAMMERTERLLKVRHAQSAAVVAGGFHAQGLTSALREKGISYCLIMPAITAVPEETNYRKHMRGEVSWSDYFEDENGKVNLYRAFARGTRDLLLKEYKEDRGVILKQWRDQIIRDLAEKNQIANAAKYTRFLDELSGSKLSAQEKFIAQWRAGVGRFTSGLRQLKNKNEITQPNIMKLFEPALTGDAATYAVTASQVRLQSSLIREIGESLSETRKLDAAAPNEKIDLISSVTAVERLAQEKRHQITEKISIPLSDSNLDYVDNGEARQVFQAFKQSIQEAPGMADFFSRDHLDLMQARLDDNPDSWRIQFDLKDGLELSVYPMLRSLPEKLWVNVLRVKNKETGVQKYVGYMLYRLRSLESENVQAFAANISFDLFIPYRNKRDNEIPFVSQDIFEHSLQTIHAFHQQFFKQKIERFEIQAETQLVDNKSADGVQIGKGTSNTRFYLNSGFYPEGNYQKANLAWGSYLKGESLDISGLMNSSERWILPLRTTAPPSLERSEARNPEIPDLKNRIGTDRYETWPEVYGSDPLDHVLTDRFYAAVITEIQRRAEYFQKNQSARVLGLGFGAGIGPMEILYQTLIVQRVPRLDMDLVEISRPAFENAAVNLQNQLHELKIPFLLSDKPNSKIFKLGENGRRGKIRLYKASIGYETKRFKSEKYDIAFFNAPTARSDQEIRISEEFDSGEDLSVFLMKREDFFRLVFQEFSRLLEQDGIGITANVTENIKIGRSWMRAKARSIAMEIVNDQDPPQPLRRIPKHFYQDEDHTRTLFRIVHQSAVRRAEARPETRGHGDFLHRGKQTRAYFDANRTQFEKREVTSRFRNPLMKFLLKRAKNAYLSLEMKALFSKRLKEMRSADFKIYSILPQHSGPEDYLEGLYDDQQHKLYISQDYLAFLENQGPPVADYEHALFHEVMYPARKVLVLGASGFLGGEIYKAMNRIYPDVVGTSHTKVRGGLISVDVTSETDLLKLIEQEKPDAVIYAAGVADVQTAETEKDRAVLLNAGIPQMLADHFKGQLIYLSSDYIFDGKNPPYTPSAAAAPVNFYGETKARGEQAVLAHPQNSVLRFGMIFGSFDPTERDFSQRLVLHMEGFKKGDAPLVLDDTQIRHPIWVSDIAKLAVDSVNERKQGALQMNGTQGMTQFQFAQEVEKIYREALGEDMHAPLPADPFWVAAPSSHKGEIVRPQNAQMVNTGAPTPFSKALNSVIFRYPGLTLRHFYEALLTGDSKRFNKLAAVLTRKKVRWAITGNQEKLPVWEGPQPAVHRYADRAQIHNILNKDFKMTASSRIRIDRVINAGILNTPESELQILFSKQVQSLDPSKKPYFELDMVSRSRSVTALTYLMLHGYSEMMSAGPDILKISVPLQENDDRGVIAQKLHGGSFSSVNRMIRSDGSTLIEKRAKTAEDGGKLLAEAQYMQQLQKSGDSAGHWFPSIFSIREEAGETIVQMEDIPWPNLTNVVQLSFAERAYDSFAGASGRQVSKKTQMQVLKNIYRLLTPDFYSKVQSATPPDFIERYHFKKVEDRWRLAAEKSEFVKRLLEAPYLELTDYKQPLMPNLKLMMNVLRQIALAHPELFTPPYLSRQHGDLHEGNILVDPFDFVASGEIRDMKLIDPKYIPEGNDPLYDFAKLLHNYFGHYDLALDYSQTFHFHINLPQGQKAPAVFSQYFDDDAMGTEMMLSRIDMFNEEVMDFYRSSSSDSLFPFEKDPIAWRIRLLFTLTTLMAGLLPYHTAGDKYEHKVGILYERTAELLSTLLDGLRAQGLMKDIPGLHKEWENLDKARIENNRTAFEKALEAVKALTPGRSEARTQILTKEKKRADVSRDVLLEKKAFDLELEKVNLYPLPARRRSQKTAEIAEIIVDLFKPGAKKTPDAAVPHQIHEIAVSDLEGLIQAVVKALDRRIAVLEAKGQSLDDGVLVLRGALDLARKLLAQKRSDSGEIPPLKVTFGVNFSKNPDLSSFLEEIIKDVTTNGISAEVFSDKKTHEAFSRKVTRTLREFLHLGKLNSRAWTEGTVIRGEGLSIATAVDTVETADSLDKIFQGLFFDKEGMSQDPDTQLAGQILFAAFLIKLAMISAQNSTKKFQSVSERAAFLQGELIRAIGEANYLNTGENAFRAQSGGLIKITGNELIGGLIQDMQSRAEVRKAA